MCKLVPSHPQSEGGFFPVYNTPFFAFYVETSQASWNEDDRRITFFKIFTSGKSVTSTLCSCRVVVFARYHQTFAHEGLQGNAQSICWCCVVRSNIQFPTASATLKPFTKIPFQVSSYKLWECSKHELKNNPELADCITGRKAYKLTFLYCIIADISWRVHSGGLQ